MALIARMLAALLPLAAQTTLSEGAVTIILDQDHSGVRIIVGYTSLHGMRDGDEHVYCDAIERCILERKLLDGISAITTARFAAKPTSFNNMNIVQSRHAAMIYWDDGVCLYRKSGPVLRLGFCDGKPDSGRHTTNIQLIDTYK
jgi:hypothetical protein